MSIESYNREQARILRSKIGEDFDEFLERLLKIIEGRNGMDTEAKGPTEVQLQRIPYHGILAALRKKNAKPVAGNDA